MGNLPKLNFLYSLNMRV